MQFILEMTKGSYRNQYLFRIITVWIFMKISYEISIYFVLLLYMDIYKNILKIQYLIQFSNETG